MSEADARSLPRTGAIIESLRLHQWIKNLFVFAPPMFARELTDMDQILASSLAFASFCAASSASYVLNDLIDLEQDRVHPTKRLRPIASGRLPIPTAVVLLAVLTAASVLVSLLLVNVATATVIAMYIAGNLAYAYFLKHLVIIDVMFIAFGFLMRILAGAFATSVAPSYWLVLCTLTVSLFLGFTKRRAELVELRDLAQDHRRVLEHYSPAFLDQMIAIATSATLVCYILYTVDDRTVSTFGSHALVISVPFVMYGLFRYLYLSYHRSMGGNPSKAVVLDLPFIINIVLWAATCFLVIYLGDRLAEWAPWLGSEGMKL